MSTQTKRRKSKKGAAKIKVKSSATIKKKGSVKDSTLKAPTVVPSNVPTFRVRIRKK